VLVIAFAGGSFGQDKKEIAAEKMAKISFNMSDQEFQRLRVTLPRPLDTPWTGPFYDSETCFDNDTVKLAAVDVLPIWIRKAVAAGEPELAAAYLWTYLKFTGDKDQKISTKAVITLYRMGDWDDIAFHRMRRWIESRFQYSYRDVHVSDPNDIRQQVLRELDFYRDSRMNNVIYDEWSKRKDNEGEDLASVDYAYWLECHDRQLPVDYWLSRLETPYAFENALKVLEIRKPEGLIERLQSRFQHLSARSLSSPDAGRAAEVASVLFRVTGEAKYRDYLMAQAQTQLLSKSFDGSLPQTLKSLAATNDKAVLDTLSNAMQNKNVMIHEAAIDALGSSKSPEAADILYESAMQEAKTRFPAHQLDALLHQNDPRSDSKYERLQQGLLSGEFGWHATSSDFAGYEFFRKHGRH